MEPDATWIWIKNLIQQGESEAIEFKGTLPGDEVFARVLSAFANTRGGVLIVGVDEDGTIRGVPSEQVSPGKQRLENVASSLRSGGRS